MALPTLSKSWYLVPNVDSTTSYPQVLYDRKQILKGVAYGGRSIGSNAWIVVGSSNSVAAGMDGVDRWASLSNVIRNTSTSGARSWIVLRNPATGRQMLIDYVGSDATTCRVQFSLVAGFTGGSTTAAPTATDAIDIEDTGPTTVLGDVLSGTKIIQHVWQSVDGRQTIMVNTQNGVCFSFWMFGEIEDAPVAWAYPFISFWASGSGSISSTCWVPAIIGAAGTGHVNARVNASKRATVYGVIEGVNTGSGTLPINNAGGSALNLKNELSTTWDILDKFYFQSEDVDLWGPLGYWPDLFPTMTVQSGFATGDHFPADGSRQFVKVNDIVLPWLGAPAMVLS